MRIQKLLLMLPAILCLAAKGQPGQVQQIKIINFTVQQQLPAEVDRWSNSPGSLLLVAQKPPTIRIEGATLGLQVRSNGALVCGSNASNGLPVDDFTTRTFSANELAGILSGCHDLKEGSYTLCAQFFNRDKLAISNEVCKPFTVVTPKTADYAPPALISPDNGKNFSPVDIQKPILFRWTPLVPKLREPVTYRMRVWQLMQGQSGTQAMRANPPLVTRDVDNITQSVVNNLWTGPCKPPYLCDYIWTVQALTKDGQPIGSNNGTSEPFVFSVQTQYIIQLDSLKVSCTDKPGQYTFSYQITNLNNSVAEFNNINVYSSSPAGATIASYSPPLGTTISSSGGTLTVTGIINASPLLANVCIKTKIQKQGDPGKNAEDYLCDSVKACRCNACDSVKIDIVQKELKFDANGNILLNANLTVSPKPVKHISAELVYFEYKPESDDCMLCNKDSKSYGNFSGGTHSQEWNFAPPQNLSNGTATSMTITVPPTVKCCNATVRWCIRYVVTFSDCTVCNKLVCYEIRKTGCASGNPNSNDQK